MSVLSAEVVPAADLDPERLRDAVGRSLSAVIAAAEALGGTVTSVSGHGVQAVFGAPEAHEDDPERAARAAFRALAGDKPETGATLRIGLETGPAIVGDVGGSRKLDYTAYGNAMNTAARLEAANKDLGSSICIGPGAAARLDATELREIGTLTLRGQSQPVRVFTPTALPDEATSPMLRPL